MVRIRNFHFSLLLPLVGCVLIGILAIYVIKHNALPLTNYRLNACAEKNSELTLKIEDLEIHNQRLQNELADLENIEKGYLLADNDLDATLLFREHVERQMNESGVLSRNIGNVRRTALVQNIICLELSLTVEGKTVPAMNFLQRLNQGKPVIYWKNLSVRPDDKDTLTVAGIVCVLCRIQPQNGKTVSVFDFYNDPELCKEPLCIAGTAMQKNAVFCRMEKKI